MSKLFKILGIVLEGQWNYFSLRKKKTLLMCRVLNYQKIKELRQHLTDFWIKKWYSLVIWKFTTFRQYCLLPETQNFVEALHRTLYLYACFWGKYFLILTNAKILNLVGYLHSILFTNVTIADCCIFYNRHIYRDMQMQ